MPTRKAADRPSRRLDAVLTTLRRHGVSEFSGTLEGLGEVRLAFGNEPIDVEARTVERRPQAGTTVPPARRVKSAPPPPLRDELEFAAEERGPIEPEANGVASA
jgi:hypothetical protein